MAKNKKNAIRSSKGQATKASKVLSNPKEPRKVRSLAGSVLGNRKART